MQLSKDYGGERPAPREVSEIFADLRSLAQSDGALHSISSIFYRDWIITVDMKEGKVVDDAEHRWSTTKLNNNEMLLLLGLTVQSNTEKTFSVLPDNDGFSERADHLLREFHDRLMMEAFSHIDFSAAKSTEGPDTLGALAREAIYYGADSFYMHQYEQFSRHRYRHDGEWLLGNVGLSIRPMLEIARFIVDRINLQLTATMAVHGETHSVNFSDQTDSLLVSKIELAKKFGEKAEDFISKFSTPILNANLKFTNPFDVNQVSLAPLIDMGDVLYVPNQYRLFETIYESPFYWMGDDLQYIDTAAIHRGEFLEKTTTHLLRSVFGTDHVFENVTIHRSPKKIAGEADVLVVYGEFVIIVQAKSKRITLDARAGDIDALKADFEGAVQTPYRQAYEFAELIQSGAECQTKDGNVMTFPRTVRVFPAVILSDHFPSSTILSSFMLERSGRIAPVIWDLGVLDCVTRILPSPVDLLFYLKCRSDAFEHINSDSEFNFLGYHLRNKLVLPTDVDWMMIERDFATAIDDFMISRDMKIERERPIGILEHIEIPVISDLLKSLKDSPPQFASVVIDLYGFSSAALEDLSRQALLLREEVSGGKKFKAFSILTESGGLTYLVCHQFNAIIQSAAVAIGTKHKYDSKRDRWYVVIDSIETKTPIDAFLPILGTWEEDEGLAEHSQHVASFFGSKRQKSTVGEASSDTNASDATHKRGEKSKD